MELASDLKTDANILKPHVYTAARLFAFLKLIQKAKQITNQYNQKKMS